MEISASPFTGRKLRSARYSGFEPVIPLQYLALMRSESDDLIFLYREEDGGPRGMMAPLASRLWSKEAFQAWIGGRRPAKQQKDKSRSPAKDGF